MAKNSSLQIYGLIGYPIKHSLSPVMHNAAFKDLNINAEYRLFEIKPEELEDFLLKDIEVKDIYGNPVFTTDISGFNITIPHKVKAREILEQKFPLVPSEELFYNVKISGAINTVKSLGNKLGYWNTDIFGFCKALKEDLKFDNKDKNVLLIGCGGTGRAIIAGLSWKKQYTRKIYIYENNEQVVRSAQKYFFQDLSSQFSFLKQKLEFISIGQIPQVIKKCQLLVNATPIGMESDEGSAIDKNLLEENKHLSVYDVVYNRETRLIKDAKSLELPARGGLGMLLYQGARSFEIWTGKEAPIEIMRQALNKEVNKL